MPRQASKNFQRIPCEICGGNAFATICEWNNLSKVVQCQKCGLQFVNPIPDQKFLDQLYQQDEENNHYYLNYIQERRDRWTSYQKQYNRRLALIEKYSERKGRLLDIGCGGGFFLQAARERGWEPHGIDIVPPFVNFAQEELRLENVHAALFDQKEYPDHYFDVVVLWDLIEHLPHPSVYLKKINKILRPGGLLVIWTPNAQNAAWLKGKWFGYTPLQHLYFFSSHTLKEILKQSGFRIAYQNTNRAKKGFFSQPKGTPYQKPGNPPKGIHKIVRGIKRDLKNLVNPINYISPFLDWAGYGFNLYVVGKKLSDIPPHQGKSNTLSSQPGMANSQPVSKSHE